jgi:hypothetical protein
LYDVIHQTQSAVVKEGRTGRNEWACERGRKERKERKEGKKTGRKGRTGRKDGKNTRPGVP